MDKSVALHRDDGLASARSQIVADGVAVVAQVGDQDLRRWAGLGHDRTIAPGGDGLAGRQLMGDGETGTVRTEVNLGRDATTRTADIVARRACCASPFPAPAERWWAQRILLSIIWTLARPPSLSFSASKITSQTPGSVQRRTCRQTHVHFGTLASRSRNGAPVRAIQKIASRIAR